MLTRKIDHDLPCDSDYMIGSDPKDEFLVKKTKPSWLEKLSRCSCCLFQNKRKGILDQYEKDENTLRHKRELIL